MQHVTPFMLMQFLVPLWFILHSLMPFEVFEVTSNQFELLTIETRRYKTNKNGLTLQKNFKIEDRYCLQVKVLNLGLK